MGVQDVFDASVDTLDHAMGLGTTGRHQTVFDALLGIHWIEGVGAGRLSGLDQEVIGKLRAVVGEDLLEAEGGGLDHGLQERLGGAGSAVLFRGGVDPASGANAVG